MKRVVWFAFVILTTLAVLILLWQFSIAIVLFVMSLAVAAAVGPSISYLTEQSYSRSVALGIVYGLLICFILLVMGVISQLLLQDLQRITEDFFIGYERIVMQWPRGGTLFQQTLAEQLPPTDELFTALTSEEGFTAVTKILGIAQNLFTILGRLAIVVILSIYWSVDQLRFERLGLSLFPEEYREKALNIWRSIEVGVGAYVRSELIQSVLVGIVLGLSYWLMGVRYPTLLALWVAIARIIPWFGAMVAVIPPLVVGIGSSPGLGAFVSIYTIVALLLMNLVVEPRFFYRSRYNSLLIVLFVVALAEVFGIIGVMLAPPLAVAVQILFKKLFPAPVRLYTDNLIERAKYLNDRFSRLESRIHQKNQEIPQEALATFGQIQNLMDKLTYRLREY